MLHRYRPARIDQKRREHQVLLRPDRRAERPVVLMYRDMYRDRAEHLELLVMTWHRGSCWH
jgi:hypothetical protein